MAKYSITEETMVHRGITLYRIKDELLSRAGGWVQGEHNLSQNGKAWIAENAKVYDNAQVFGDALISGDAEVYGQAQVYGNAMVYDYAEVCEGASVYENAEVYDSGVVKGIAQVYGTARINEDQVVLGIEHVYQALWRDINKITSLKINIQGGQKEANLYANGRHQVCVEVVLVATDRNNRNIIVQEAEVYKHMTFVDYNNRSLEHQLIWSDKAGDYAHPYRLGTSQSNKISTGLFYLSTTMDSELLKVCVRCEVLEWIVNFEHSEEEIMRREVVYSTAENNNNGNAIVDYVILNIRPKRPFSIDDIDVFTVEEKNIGGYNCILLKYYVRFRDIDSLVLYRGECTSDDWFHYKQKGNYKGCATSTDSNVDINLESYHTAVFRFTNHWTINVKAKNHESRGICLWTYRVWHGGLWSTKVRDHIFTMTLFDQFGNDALISVKALNDVVLQFDVIR